MRASRAPFSASYLSVVPSSSPSRRTSTSVAQAVGQLLTDRKLPVPIPAGGWSAWNDWQKVGVVGAIGAFAALIIGALVRTRE